MIEALVCEEESLSVLERHHSNPLITPRPKNKWEESATFNPGGVLDGGTFHLFYRAVNVNGISSIGYVAVTSDMEAVTRLDAPILTPDQECEELGCEDPRITRIENTTYMLYTAYSCKGPRIALALSSGLDRFRKVGLVGPDLPDKDAALLPKTINGKHVMFHRIEPSIQVAYFDNPQLQELSDPSLRSQYWTEYLRNLEAHTIMKPEEEWERRKVGIGPPPIETSYGWLIIYHGVDDNFVYRAGAALADLDDPSKIVARSRTPILEPIEPYEKQGFVQNVVFPEAAMVLDGILYVFYGAADTVCCIATTPLDEFLRSLSQQR
ncbi:MAG: glycosidase [archaeon]